LDKGAGLIVSRAVNAAVRRYYLRFAIAMGVYVFALVGAIAALRFVPPGGALRFPLALAPAIPLVGVIVALGRYLVEEDDEFRRTLLVQSMLWALGGTLVVTTVWGFLQEWASVPRLPLYLVFPIFCIGMAIAQPFLFRRYR